MKLHIRGKVFYCESSFEEKDIPKQAGFWWHPANCTRDRCQACNEGLVNKWWTPFDNKAVKLIEFASDDARKALQSTDKKLKASKATNTEIDFPKPKGLNYLGYQKAGIRYALEHNHVLIGDEMGLGKTIQALGIINADDEIKTALIICPAPLRINWEREAKKWLTRSTTINAILKNTKKYRELMSKSNIVIVNYDLLKGDILKHLMSRKWDMLIVDEAHYLKNPKAARTKKVLGEPKKWGKRGAEWYIKEEAVPGLFDNVEGRSAFLTGTPICNRPKELWPIISRLDSDTWKAKSKFEKRYCAAVKTRWGWDNNGAANLEELQDRLRTSCMVRRLKQDVLKDLPAKFRQVITLDNSEVEDLIKQENKLFNAAGGFPSDIHELESFTMKFEELAAARATMAQAKIEYAVEHITECLESGIEKIVVWAHHHTLVDALYNEFESIAVKADGRSSNTAKQNAVDSFQNDSNVQLFIGGIKALGVGVTLTAASHEVFCELPYVPSDVVQAEDRCHRIGQHYPVTIQYLVFDDSLDARVAQIMANKDEIIRQALDTDTSLDIKELQRIADETKKQRKTKRKAPDFKVSGEYLIAVKGALVQLAGTCDGARQKDGQGFNRFDTKFGHELAFMPRLSDAQVVAGGNLVYKYKGQLPEDIVETIKEGNKANFAAMQARSKRKK